MNREELAWAAGFFDGEGYARGRTPGGKGMAMVVSQKTPVLLERFRSAVGGVGAIGVAKSWGGYQYTVTNFQYVQAIIAMLWRWLGPIKRDQAIQALASAPDASRGVRGSTVCRAGHPKATGSGKHCKTCRREYNRRWIAAKRQKQRGLESFGQEALMSSGAE